MMVCGGPALNLFHAQELETLVCGEDRLDFDALRKNARYDGGYNAESQAAVWLWEVSRHRRQTPLALFAVVPSFITTVVADNVIFVSM
jgi:hypothetical protein